MDPHEDVEKPAKANTPNDVSAKANYARPKARPKATAEAIFGTRDVRGKPCYSHNMSLVALSYLDAARKSLMKSMAKCLLPSRKKLRK